MPDSEGGGWECLQTQVTLKTSWRLWFCILWRTILTGNSAASQTQKFYPSKSLRKNSSVGYCLMNLKPLSSSHSAMASCLPHTRARGSKEQLEVPLGKGRVPSVPSQMKSDLSLRVNFATFNSYNISDWISVECQQSNSMVAFFWFKEYLVLAVIRKQGMCESVLISIYIYMHL